MFESVWDKPESPDSAKKNILVSKKIYYVLLISGIINLLHLAGRQLPVYKDAKAVDRISKPYQELDPRLVYALHNAWWIHQSELPQWSDPLDPIQDESQALVENTKMPTKMAYTSEEMQTICSSMLSVDENTPQDFSMIVETWEYTITFGRNNTLNKHYIIIAKGENEVFFWKSGNANWITLGDENLGKIFSELLDTAGQK